MSIAEFSLVRKIPLTLYRKTEGSYIEGVWTSGVETTVDILANVQPLLDEEYMRIPEADRTKQWIRLFSNSELRTLKEGVDGWSADEFFWNSERYQIMRVQRYQMSVRDHWEAKAARIPLTPN